MHSSFTNPLASCSRLTVDAHDLDGLLAGVHAGAAPLHKRLGCTHFAAASLDHCIQLQRLFLGLARHQKAARTCLARAAQVAPHGRCYADGGKCFLL